MLDLGISGIESGIPTPIKSAEAPSSMNFTPLRPDFLKRSAEYPLPMPLQPSPEDKIVANQLLSQIMSETPSRKPEEVIKNIEASSTVAQAESPKTLVEWIKNIFAKFWKWLNT